MSAVSSNKGGGGGASALADTKRLVMDVTGNELGDHGATALAEGFRDGSAKNLQDLDLYREYRTLQHHAVIIVARSS